MTTDRRNSALLILGAGGRLGTMLRRIWAIDPPFGIDLHFQSRAAQQGRQNHQWSPGDPPENLPAVDTVIALWGQTSGDAETLALNIALAGHSRAVALKCGASRLLHLSSAAVYGPIENAKEDASPKPLNPYGQSKRALETRVATFDDTQLQHCCLRLANVVGADSLAAGLTGDKPVPLDRFADGRGPLRSYVGARDLADILLALSSLPPVDLPTILNVAAHDPVTMEDLLEAAEKEIAWRDAPLTATQCVTLNTDRLAQLLPTLHPTSDAAELIQRWQEHRNRE